MSLLLDLPPAERAPHAQPPERAVLEGLARSAATRGLRLQALVELMALEVATGNELGFERMRHELAATRLPPGVATLFQVRMSWGLAAFGRTAAAARARRRVEAVRDGAEVQAWLLELDRLLDLTPR